MNCLWTEILTISWTLGRIPGLKHRLNCVLGVEEGDENQGGVPKGGQECDEEDTDGKKKEKKKKKNRGRRHKAKAAAAAAAACGDALVNQREAEKVAPERNEPNFCALTSEVEVGCICGTPKGGSHNSNCPYPFTSSGSMIQRKIKEQYDELVRSNVAKTLTLAQVPTHCSTFMLFHTCSSA